MTAYAETKLRCVIREYVKQNNLTVAECPMLREIFEDVGQDLWLVGAGWVRRFIPKRISESRQRG